MEASSSNPSNMKSDPIVLKEDNYAEWSAWVKDILLTKEIWSVIQSPEPSGQEDVGDSSSDRREKNVKALRIICNNCGEKAFSNINGCNSASHAWKILEAKFAMVDSISEDNFVDWSVRMKSFLVARDLWSVVDPMEEDNESYSKKNLKALQEIRNFCDWEALSKINGINSAKEAWDALVKKYDVQDGIKADGNNYADWSDRVKSSLKAQDLWNIIEEPTKIKDDEKNSKALEVIRRSCGWEAFSHINDNSSAQRAWDILAERYGMRDRIEKGKDLVKAVQSRNLETVKQFLRQHPSIVGAKITCWEETALHVAVAIGEHYIVEQLVELMSKKDLETVDDEGYTALAQATIRGHDQMVKCMLKKNGNLIFNKAANRRIPVVLAIEYRHKYLAHYLYNRTPLKVLKQDKGIQGATVCTQAIYNGMLDIAWCLIKSQLTLALAVDVDKRSPLFALASTYAFFSGSRLGSWKRRIFHYYHHCFCSSVNRSDEQSRSALPVDENSVNIEIDQTGGSDYCHVNNRSEQLQNKGLVPALLHRLIPSLRKHWDVYLEEKKSFDLAQKLLSKMSEQISISTEEDLDNGRVFSSVNLAAREGMSNFLTEILDKNNGLKWTLDHDGRNIFSNAVLHRQAKIYKMMRDSPEKEVMIKSLDDKKNNILHMAGMLAPATQLDRIPGAALQMQYELRWFQKVESIVPPTLTKAKNIDDLTPKELFAKTHKELRKEGEKWMRDSAASFTVVGALIITITFAVAFTVPGGFNQETGLPMFLNKKLLKVFMVCDSISLLSSSTSVLMFLGILTSRYADEDFLESLPRKLIRGLSTLFLSIAAMMIAFCAALVLMLQGEASIFISIFCLAGLPVALFVLMQSRLLIDVAKSILASNIEK